MAGLIGYVLAAVVAAILIAREIAHRRRRAALQDQLAAAARQSTRSGELAHVGVLVSDLAQQLKAPLQGVLGATELMLASNAPGDPVEDLRHLRDDATRAADIVRNLLVFTEATSLERRWSDVNGIVDRAVALCRSELATASVRVDRRPADRLPLVYVDARMIEKVLLMLLHRPANGNRLRNAARPVLATVSTSRRQTPDDAIVIEVDDDSVVRMSEAEAFGSGGLAACIRIVEAHGGRMTLTQRPSGMHVEVTLPIAAGTAIMESATTVLMDARSGPSHG